MNTGLCVCQRRGLAVEPAKQRLEVCAGDLRLLLCVQRFISIIRRFLLLRKIALQILNFPMPAEAATNVVNII